MAIRTEETFQLQAPPDRVWAYLIDPRQVVTCLPGAELTAVQDESTFLGKVKVKVGPVLAAYSGKVVIAERDDSARVVRMLGEGRESAGGGSAKVTITSAVVELPAGGTEVRVTADLDIVGRIAQFGRGMIESVNKQMFRQFTACVRATLETPGMGAASTVTGAPPSAQDGAGARALSTSSGAGGEASAAHDGDTRPAAAPGFPPAAAADNTRYSPTPAPPATRAGQPVRLLPLLGRAVWEYLVALARRLVGRGTARSGRDG